MVDCSATWYSTLKLFLANLKFSVNSILDQGIGSCQAIICVVELQLHGSKLRGQKLLDGLHCMPLLSLKCLLWSGTTVAICSFTPEVPESGMIIWAGLMESSLVRVLG